MECSEACKILASYIKLWSMRVLFVVINVFTIFLFLWNLFSLLSFCPLHKGLGSPGHECVIEFDHLLRLTFSGPTDYSS